MVVKVIGSVEEVSNMAIRFMDRMENWENLCLVPVFMDGRKYTALCAFHATDDGNVVTSPIALFIRGDENLTSLDGRPFLVNEGGENDIARKFDDEATNKIVQELANMIAGQDSQDLEAFREFLASRS